MPLKFKDILPEKDYARLARVGPGPAACQSISLLSNGDNGNCFPWLLLAAAAVNYGVILYLYDRDRRAKKQKQAAGSGDKNHKAQIPDSLSISHGTIFHRFAYI